MPLEHTSLELHVFPQTPQLFGSDARSTHASSQVLFPGPLHSDEESGDLGSSPPHAASGSNSETARIDAVLNCEKRVLLGISDGLGLGVNRIFGR